MPPLKLVANHDTGPDPNMGSGGGDDGIDSRLRQLEIKIGQIETRLNYMPTKEDVEAVKTLIAEKESTNTRWMIGIISTALVSIGTALIGTVIVLIRTFTN